MGSRRVQPLTGEAVEELPDPCRVCLFWELGHPRPERRLVEGRLDELAGDPLTQKQAWCATEVLDGQPPGRVVRLDDKVAGYVLFAPPRTLAPRKSPAPAASNDALLLATIFIEPHLRGSGLGRLLVQTAIKEAIARDLRAVEAYGDRRFRERDCVLPSTWLLHEGFEVHREHPRYPLLRLDVRRTLRWAESLEEALDQILVKMPRPASPRPAPQSISPE